MSVAGHRFTFRSAVAGAAVLLALAVLQTSSASADDILRERVRFAAGTSGTVLKSRIEGRDVLDYVVGARAGQTLDVSLRTDNDGASFNVLPPGSDEAIHIGAIAGNRYVGRLSADGDYVIRVALVRSAARRGEAANIRLSIAVNGRAIPADTPPLGEDFADGLAGGPDEWRVSGLTPGDLLNIRAKPSASARIVASVPNGTVLANGGCRLVGKSRWCMVDLRGGSGISGWANGRYLRE